MPFLIIRKTYSTDAIIDNISCLLGSDGTAPARVAVIAPAADANFKAASISIPSEIAVAKAPQKPSPAAVVSIALTLNAGV
jgi:hypothetical protein